MVDTRKRIVLRIILSLLILSGIFFIIKVDSNNTTTDDISFSNPEKRYLINLARQTLYWYIKYNTIPEPDAKSLTDNLKRPLGCFVTLNKHGTGLRGCIGMFVPKTPLYKNIISRTIAAATKDYRFKKVEADELELIKIDISILTPPILLKVNSPSELLAALKPNIHGVILQTRYGRKQSTYLPQVWGALPEKELFLSHLCQKQGAPPDTWRTDFDNINVWTYQALVFEEAVYGRYITGPRGAIVGKDGAYIIGVCRFLPDTIILGGYRINKGTYLNPGVILTPGADVKDKI